MCWSSITRWLVSTFRYLFHSPRPCRLLVDCLSPGGGSDSNYSLETSVVTCGTSSINGIFRCCTQSEASSSCLKSLYLLHTPGTSHLAGNMAPGSLREFDAAGTGIRCRGQCVAQQKIAPCFQQLSNIRTPTPWALLSTTECIGAFHYPIAIQRTPAMMLSTLPF